MAQQLTRQGAAAHRKLSVAQSTAGAGLNAFLYWWGSTTPSENGDNEGLIQINGSSVIPSGRLWAFANYSRYVHPGAVRIFEGGDFVFGNPSCIYGPDEDVPLPLGAERLDAQLRVAVVIGAGIIGGFTLTAANGDGIPATQIDDIDAIAGLVAREAKPNDVVVVMSSGAFGGVHGKILDQLREA